MLMGGYYHPLLTTVLLRTTLNQTTRLHFHMLPPVQPITESTGKKIESPLKKKKSGHLTCNFRSICLFASRKVVLLSRRFTTCVFFSDTEYLIGDGGADVNIVDQSKNTALHVSCRQVRFQLFKPFCTLTIVFIFSTLLSLHLLWY